MPNKLQISSLFIKDGRLRPTLRVILYFILLLTVAAFISQTIVFLALISGLVSTADLYSGWIAGPGGVVQYAASLISILIMTYALRRLVDRRSFISLGFARPRGWWADGLVGLALGIGLIGLVFVIELALGLITVKSVGTALAPDRIGGLISMTVIFVMVAFNEELMTRGYILQNLAEDWGLPAAALMSSMIFAFLHIDNPNVSTMALINLVLGGLLFAGGYLATRNLWLPMAMHFGWNFAEGPLFGFRVSGLQTPVVTSISQQGDQLINGGGFGPEGGLIILIPIALGGVFLWYWSKVRHRFDINTDESYHEEGAKQARWRPDGSDL